MEAGSTSPKPFFASSSGLPLLYREKLGDIARKSSLSFLIPLADILSKRLPTFLQLRIYGPGRPALVLLRRQQRVVPVAREGSIDAMCEFNGLHWLAPSRWR